MSYSTLRTLYHQGHGRWYTSKYSVFSICLFICKFRALIRKTTCRWWMVGCDLWCNIQIFLRFRPPNPIALLRIARFPQCFILGKTVPVPGYQWAIYHVQTCLLPTASHRGRGIIVWWSQTKWFLTEVYKTLHRHMAYSSWVDSSWFREGQTMAGLPPLIRLFCLSMGSYRLELPTILGIHRSAAKWWSERQKRFQISFW